MHKLQLFKGRRAKLIIYFLLNSIYVNVIWNYILVVRILMSINELNFSCTVMLSPYTYTALTYVHIEREYVEETLIQWRFCKQEKDLSEMKLVWHRNNNWKRIHSSIFNEVMHQYLLLMRFVHIFMFKDTKQSEQMYYQGDTYCDINNFMLWK